MENVLKAELVVDFEAAWVELRQRRGDGLARPKMAYHGTAEVFALSNRLLGFLS